MISIITVTYNSQDTILETIISVKEQKTKSEVEHIIIDGVSNDKTLDIIRSSSFSGHLYSEPDDGIYDGMNKGIRKAKGDIIGILNSDDLYGDNSVLARVEDCFENNNDLDLVYGDLSYFKSKSTTRYSRIWRSKSYYKNFFDDGEVPPHPTLFVRRCVYEKYGLYYPKFRIASDYELMLRLLKVNNCKSIYISCVLVKMRLGGKSTKGIHNLILNNWEVYRAWRMNSLWPPLSFYFKRPLKKVIQLFAGD